MSNLRYLRDNRFEAILIDGGIEAYWYVFCFVSIAKRAARIVAGNSAAAKPY